MILKILVGAVSGIVGMTLIIAVALGAVAAVFYLSAWTSVVFGGPFEPNFGFIVVWVLIFVGAGVGINSALSD